MGSPTNQVLVNDPIIPIDQSIYESVASSAQAAPVGTRLRLADRTYYYSQATASIPGGTLVCSLVPVASHQSGIFLVAATSAGQLVISGTSSANVAANLYAEGYFGVATGTNIGEMYRIKQQTSGSAAMAITLYDRLNTALTSGSAFFLLPNQFKNVNIGSAALGCPIGVTPCNVTSGGWFWLQTLGPCAPTHVAAVPAGAALTLGTTGSVTPFSVTGTLGATANAAIDYQVIVGKNISLASTAGQANPVYLNILA